MARKTFYLTRDQQNPLYKTRMLRAGAIDLDAGAARLYRKLGVDLADEVPGEATVPLAPPPPVAKPAAKRTRRKRKAAAKK